MDEAKERRAIENKLMGVMEYYVRTYFKHYSQKIKDEVALRNRRSFIQADCGGGREVSCGRLPYTRSSNLWKRAQGKRV